MFIAQMGICNADTNKDPETLYIYIFKKDVQTDNMPIYSEENPT